MQTALLVVSTYHCIDTLPHFPSASKILIPFFIFSFPYDARIGMVPSSERKKGFIQDKCVHGCLGGSLGEEVVSRKSLEHSCP